jgi:type IV pilus assembly protein PilA
MFKSLLKKREQGFTLVELMIVVAIIGVLAALAIYGVARYLKHSKTAEATRNLGSMETGSKNKFQQESTDDGLTFSHKFCDAAGPTPSKAPTASKTKVATGDWNAKGWECLKFSVNEPQFYSYKYVSSGTGTGAKYTATASGDLDGNNVTSLFSLTGSGTGSGDAQRDKLVIDKEDE